VQVFNLHVQTESLHYNWYSAPRMADHSNRSTDAPVEYAAPDQSKPLPGARSTLILLIAINLFNYIDRQVLAAVEPDIRRDLLLSNDAHDPNAKAKMGLLSTAFLITYMTLSPVFGVLAERFSRWWIIGIGIALWSIASGASGLAHPMFGLSAFAILLITRCFVGVGEAAYGPVAPTLLSDFYPPRMRGRILAAFNVALPVGGALGYAIGGQIASIDPAHQSWRWAFYAVVIPGLILSVIAFMRREPKAGSADVGGPVTRRAGWGDYLTILKTPSYLLNTSGMTAMTFAIGGIAWWMPDYLQTRGVAPVRGIEARTVFGGVVVLGGLFATIGGGFAGDLLRKRFSGSYFLVSGVAMLLGVPSFLLMLKVPFPYAWIFLFFTVFFLFFNAGPTNTILANVTHPAVRATAFALNILIIHTLGDAISPPLIGAIADKFNDASRPAHGLEVGFVFTTILMVVGSVLWLFGMKFLERDTELAPTRVARTE
jgi:MFS family permease